MLLVLDNDDNLLYCALEAGTGQASPNSRRGCVSQTYLVHLLSESLDCPGNVLIESWVSRLEHRGIIFLPPDEELSRVDLPHVEDGMNGNLDFKDG